MSDTVVAALDPSSSVITQAFWMRSSEFDRIKDKLITPSLQETQSLILLMPFLSAFEFTTKAPVWMHAVTWIPACVAVWSVLMTQHTIWTLLAFVCASCVAWPLAEYLLHRFVFHFPVAWADRFPRFICGPVNVFRLLVHTVHHAHPKDRMRIITPLPLSLPVAVLLLYPVFRVSPSQDMAYAWSTGMILGYVLYDMMHYYVHFGRPWELPEWLGPLKAHACALHKAHANHHFSSKGYETSFGVAHTFWDQALGTSKT